MKLENRGFPFSVTLLILGNRRATISGETECQFPMNTWRRDQLSAAYQSGNQQCLHNPGNPVHPNELC
ncbi:unnamed protein product [Linum tenue]|uniref:Secreted protein n=1 Tax=Linum tenue TaxID=586396 RepID=A0AAV0GZZ0_9ROSI|nr:unnamed protein product [Linum tenue]CAI0378586.1 unnamed protein product [Linum tenue]CAI0378588.1 unnamed protein product [Linum tenue]CAI0378591.1 unnamed protein product [Linum tenue]CAI0378595.1 unnamed protein product [Linum tenue]